MPLGSQKKSRDPKKSVLPRAVDAGKAKSVAQENAAAKQYGGKVQIASGATARHKGDVKTPEFLIEAKTRATEAQSITVQRLWLDKITMEAHACGRDPALEIQIPTKNPLAEERWVMIPASVFARLLETIREFE